jgi:hypothetical protein
MEGLDIIAHVIDADTKYERHSVVIWRCDETRISWDTSINSRMIKGGFAEARQDFPPPDCLRE